MKKAKFWDLFVRVFHWSLVIAFLLNALFVDDDSDLHQYIGYFIFIVLVLRIIWGFIGKGYARFSSFPPNPSAAREQLTDIAQNRRRVHLGHTPLGALMIYNLIISLIIVCVSGWLMTTDWFWGVEWPEEVHELFVVWCEISAFIHICAVIYESVRTKVNLPRAMITGVKKIPKDAEICD